MKKALAITSWLSVLILPWLFGWQFGVIADIAISLVAIFFVVGAFVAKQDEAIQKLQKLNDRAVRVAQENYDWGKRCHAWGKQCLSGWGWTLVLCVVIWALWGVTIWQLNKLEERATQNG